MFEFDSREAEYEWLRYLDDNGYLVPAAMFNYCTCPTPAAPEYDDMRVYVCTVCSGLVVLDSNEVSK